MRRYLAKIRATPKTNSPSRTWGPRETAHSSAKLCEIETSPRSGPNSVQIKVQATKYVPFSVAARSTFAFFGGILGTAESKLPSVGCYGKEKRGYLDRGREVRRSFSGRDAKIKRGSNDKSLPQPPSGRTQSKSTVATQSLSRF